MSCTQRTSPYPNSHQWLGAPGKLAKATGRVLWVAALVFLQGLMVSKAMASTPASIQLEGYADASGAISIVKNGTTADPYFALQALLLAYDNGMDISAPAEKFIRWLLPFQKPDGTFDRFCKRTPVGKWEACKPADADDSLLALWMRLLEIKPALLAKEPLWAKSHAASKAALKNLYQPSRGVYMVSPVVLHGLFMDNLEVWSLKASLGKTNSAESKALAEAINRTFWNPVNKQFTVSTQLEQGAQKPAFYPDSVAQIFPLLVDFPLLPKPSRAYYQEWMKSNRTDWLAQGELDYPWGLLAVLAVRQGDKVTAGCWLRTVTSMRHSARWAVTDEVSLQILQHRKIAPAAAGAPCG